jgi:hypothetical protein
LYLTEKTSELGTPVFPAYGHVVIGVGGTPMAMVFLAAGTFADAGVVTGVEQKDTLASEHPVGLVD